MQELRFGESYEEEATLSDGTPVWLRLVRPSDKVLFTDAWTRLSVESRYRRFMSHKKALTPKDLAYLTELDGQRHVAIGAMTGPPDQGLGVARFVRLENRPEVAEAAVVVVDHAHRKGLGRLLLTRLTWAARERGVELFQCEILSHNREMRALLRGLAPGARERPDGATVLVEVPVDLVKTGPPPETVNREAALYRVFRLASEATVELGHTLGELGRLQEE